MSRLADDDASFRRRLRQRRRRREAMGVGDDLPECPPPPFRKGPWHHCELSRGHAGYHQWADPKSPNLKRTFWDGHGQAVQQSEVMCEYCHGEQSVDLVYIRRMSTRYEENHRNYTLACCDACFDQIEDTNREELADYESGLI